MYELFNSILQAKQCYFKLLLVGECALNFGSSVKITDLYLLVNVGFKKKKLPISLYNNSKCLITSKSDSKLTDKSTHLLLLLEGSYNFNSASEVLGKLNIPLSSVFDETSLMAWYIINPTAEEVLISGKLCLTITLVPAHSAKKVTYVTKLDNIWQITNNCDTDALNNLLECQNIDLNAKNQNGESPLHILVKKNFWSDKDTKFLSRLLDHSSIDVNATDLGGNTSFHYFFQKFSNADFITIFNKFISLNAQVNANNDLGETPLHKAILNKNLSLSAIELLIENGSNVNARTKLGNTPLSYAVYVGAHEVVKLLLMKDADINVKTNDNKSIFDICLEENQLELLEMLDQSAKLIEFLNQNNLLEIKETFLYHDIFIANLRNLTNFLLLKILDDKHKYLIPKILSAVKDLNDIYFNKDLKDLTSRQKNYLSASYNIRKNYEIRNYLNQTLHTRVLRCKKSINALKVGNLSHAQIFKFSSRTSVPAIDCNKDSVKYSWEIDYEDLNFINLLGQGSFSQVYLGTYKGKEVAIKVINQYSDHSEVELFKKEFSVMFSIQSESIITLYGACIVNKLCMVMEYCPWKSLHDLMKRNDFEMTWTKFFSFAMDISSGLSALHNAQPAILHRDFKTPNILVTKNFRCKLCDFGLSRFNTNSNLKTLFKCRGTYAYIAPEVYECEMFTTKSDVYALAIVFWEMINRIIVGVYQAPYEEYKEINFDFQILVRASTGGLRPRLPENTPKPLADLVVTCWSDDRNVRLGTWEVFKRIKDVKLQYESERENWDALAYQNNQFKH